MQKSVNLMVYTDRDSGQVPGERVSQSLEVEKVAQRCRDWPRELVVG